MGAKHNIDVLVDNILSSLLQYYNYDLDLVEMAIYEIEDEYLAKKLLERLEQLKKEYYYTPN